MSRWKQRNVDNERSHRGWSLDILHWKASSNSGMHSTVTPNSGLKDVEVWDNSGVVLQNDQYKIDDGVVKPADGWGGNLALITFRQ
ncbi:hypothetical protein NQ176_g1018 [Zarea fungicola]|uniref:Uncharacterized protein n=1 Tax=Zarea fungicola TaxID=93591 RepID=A0ACC1NV41_9HYPO|nr:hypothetical protein NQ176_g1018 [Lecanicillium fungicola]